MNNNQMKNAKQKSKKLNIKENCRLL